MSAELFLKLNVTLVRHSLSLIFSLHRNLKTYSNIVYNVHVTRSQPLDIQIHFMIEIPLFHEIKHNFLLIA